MGDVLHFWGHRFLPNEQGLGYCPTCGGIEGTLPEHCPQRRMTEQEIDDVWEGRLDFRRSAGGWTSHTRDREMLIRRDYT